VKATYLTLTYLYATAISNSLAGLLGVSRIQALAL